MTQASSPPGRRHAGRAALRALLARGTCSYAASVFDPFSARMAEELGFPFGILGGSAASLAILGDPDMVLITLGEFAEQVRRIARASALPLVVDADHGYGNALNVRRTVQEIEAAGAAGLTVEDTALPLAFGDIGKSGLIPLDEAVGKLRAAVDARSETDLVIIGRTALAYARDFADLEARAAAYARTGIDALFVGALQTPNQLRAIAGVTRLPLMLGAIRPALDDPALLAECGVKLCLQGHEPFAAGARAVYEALQRQRGATRPALGPDGLVDRIAGKARLADLIRRFMS